MNTLSEPVLTKRPLFFAAAAWLFGILAGAGLSFCSPALPALCLLGILGAILLKKHKKTAALMLLAAVFFLGMGAASYKLNSPMHGFRMDVEHIVSGRVRQLSVSASGKNRVRLQNASVDGIAISGDVVMGVTTSFEEDDIISATARLRFPKAAQFEGDFDDRMYCASEGIVYRAEAVREQKTGEARDLFAFSRRLSRKAEALMDTLYAEQAATAKALLLGKTDGMDKELLEGFRNTGISHLLAVSGLHVGILVGALVLLLRLLKLGHHIVFLIAFPLLVFYVILTGMRPSAMRAGIMMALMLLSRAIGKRGDGLTSLSLAFILLTLANPLIVFGAGFSMSFAAVFSIMCLAPRRKSGEGRKKWVVLSAMAVGVAAVLGTIPISANMSGRLWLPSVLLNTAAVMYTGVCVPVIAVITLLGTLFGGELFLGRLGELMLMPYTGWAAGAELFPWGTVRLPYFAPLVTVLIFVLIFWLSKYMHIRRRLRITAGAAAALVIAAGVAIPLFAPKAASIHIFDCYAPTVLVRSSEGNSVFIGEDILYASDYMEKRLIAPDAAVMLRADVYSLSAMENSVNTVCYLKGLGAVSANSHMLANERVSLGKLWVQAYYAKESAAGAPWAVLIGQEETGLLLIIEDVRIFRELPAAFRSAKAMYILKGTAKQIGFKMRLPETAVVFGSANDTLRAWLDETRLYETKKHGIINISCDGTGKVETGFDG